MLKNIIFLLFFSILFLTPFVIKAEVVINEIAWMGDKNSYSNEWIELLNNNNYDIDLSNWKIESESKNFLIELEGKIPAGGYFLLERTDDETVKNISANQIYSGSLKNTGDILFLKNSFEEIVDKIDCADNWSAGDNTSKRTMERKNNKWQTSAQPNGTPKAKNSNGFQEISQTKKNSASKSNNYSEDYQVISDLELLNLKKPKTYNQAKLSLIIFIILILLLSFILLIKKIKKKSS